MSVTGPLAWAAVAAASLAAAAHLFIFVNESILFRRPATLRMLEVRPEHAEAVRLWAFHQGVYNALLAALAIVGAVALLIHADAGAVLLLAAFGMMIVAAAALLAVDRRRERVPGFVAQSLPAALGVILLLV